MGKANPHSSRSKPHYAWMIVLSCILLKAGLGGVVASISGNFVTPVVTDLGCSVSQFTTFISIEAASMALLYMTAANVLSRSRPGIVMGIGALMQMLGVGLMSTYRTVYMFYLSGALIGAGGAFTGFVAVPIVINMWFHKKAGTVLGIIIAVENISTILYSLLSAQLIIHLGWRHAYLVLAAIGLVISVPPLFLFVKSPAEMDCEPYGADSPNTSAAVSSGASAPSLTRRQAFHMPVFYIAWLTCMLYSFGCGVQQYIATFTTMELGQSISFGATAAMCMSLGCVLSSVILGYVNDKFGVTAGLGWGAIFIALGYGTMLYSLQHPTFSILGALLVGLGGSMYTVQCPLLARTVLGSEGYSSIWSLMMMGNSLIGAFTFSSIGLFYDKGGSYRGAFIMAIGLYTAAFLLGSFAVRIAKRTAAKSSAA